MFAISLKIAAVAAMDEDRVIGADNQIPWHLPEDLKRFSSLTAGHTVLMGRKTYQSLKLPYRPLPRRKNVVITRDPSQLADEKGIETASSPERFIQACKRGDIVLPSEKLWIIGGEQIYRQTVEYWDEVYLTVVHGKHEGDAHFVEFEDQFRLVEREEHRGFSFLHYLRG